MQSSAAPAGIADQLPIVHRWVSGLRWCVFLLMTIALLIGERSFGLSVDHGLALGILVAAIAISAIGERLLGRERASSPRWVGRSVAFDLVTLGALLAVSGGAANPFSALFFVYVALAASLLPARTAAGLVALATVVFASLFLLPVGSCCPNHPAHGAFSAHLYGMLFAFVLGAALVTYFLTNVRRVLDRHGAEIAELRSRAEQGARFTAIGTLAAGTAHELNTPLGTIYVVASELAAEHPEDSRAGAAARRIRQQVERCRSVLTKLQGAARQPSPEEVIPAAPAVEQAVSVWRRAHPDIDVSVDDCTGATLTVGLSQDEMSAALSILLDNALFASEAAGDVGTRAIRVAIHRHADRVSIRVHDRGAGVDPALADRLGEPFVTSKEPGEGMGLGLFWVRSMLDRVGGKLTVSNEARGTTVTLDLSAEPA
jgi:two-component system, sensor histidine kinase RegB